MKITLRQDKETGQIFMFGRNKANKWPFWCFSLIGGHSEASADYYYNETKPLNDLDNLDVALMLDIYKRNGGKFKIVKKL